MACELIIELGDMDFWNDKTMEYKKQMTEVYKDQIYKFVEVIPAFKVANAVVHYDETSPHMHLVGEPVKDGYKNGMKKQVAKSQIFTKTSLKEIQDKMRKYCIEKFNEVYEQNATLKKKQKGRNRDINVNDMGGYSECAPVRCLIYSRWKSYLVRSNQPLVPRFWSCNCEVTI